MKLSPTALAILLTAPTALAFAPQFHRNPLRPLYAEDKQEDAVQYTDEADEELKKLTNALKYDIPRRFAEALPSADAIVQLAMDEKVRDLGYNPDEVKRALGTSDLTTLDGHDPDLYIRHRPGKYGWTPAQLTPEAQKNYDSGLRQRLKPEQRDINWEDHKDAYNAYVEAHKFPNPNRADEAYKVYIKTMEVDPWYELNERLEDAVMYDETEEIEYLKSCIDKIDGPPPCLKNKLLPEGYVSAKDIYGLSLISNDRLKDMIEKAKFELTDLSQRQEAAVSKLQDIEFDKEVQSEDYKEAEIEYIAKRQEERRRREWWGIGERKRMPLEEWEASKDDFDKERQELLQQWKELGQDKTPEEIFWDMDGRKKRLSDTFAKVAAEERRKDTLFIDEEDMEYDEYGIPIVDDSFFKPGRPMNNVEKYMDSLKYDANGNLRPMGDDDVFNAELAPGTEVNEGSSCTSGPLTVDVNSCYNAEQSDPQARKHTFQYTVRITNNSDKDTVQLLSRKFFIQPLMSRYKDVVEGQGVTGRQPILKPGEVFEYTSTAPLNTRPISSTIIAARMSGEYRYCTLQEGQETATEEQINGGKGDAAAELGMFHFVFPEDQRVKVSLTNEEDDDDDDDAAPSQTVISGSQPARSVPPSAQDAQTIPRPQANSLPGDPDITSGNIAGTPNESSDTVSSDVRVVVSTKFLPERSDKNSNKFTFAYNVRISNEKKDQAIQLVSRRFEIQNIGSQTKDVVQGANVTGRQPVLKPGENFEYTSTAPLSAMPMLDKTRVLSRMSGEFNCVLLADDGVTPLSSTPLKAELGTIHFVLPEDQ